MTLAVQSDKSIRWCAQCNLYRHTDAKIRFIYKRETALTYTVIDAPGHTYTHVHACTQAQTCEDLHRYHTIWKSEHVEMLTHWGRVTHICVSKLTIIGSDNGLSSGRRQVIIWTNDGIVLIRTLFTNFSENLSEIHSFSLKKMHLKMSSAKWRLFRLGLNELSTLSLIMTTNDDTGH